MTPLRIGFVGAGRMGRHHARLLAPRAILAAVADVNFERARELAGAYNARPYREYRQMFDQEGLDAVFILTPPDIRLEPIRMACQRSVAIFVEKPPARTLDKAQQIADLLDAAGVVNSVGFMYRWMQAVARAAKVLETQTILGVQSVFVCGVALDPAQPKWTFLQDHAGGPLLEQAIHSIDALRYLVGDIAEIRALGGNPILPKLEDFTIEDSHALCFRFESDAVGIHLHSWAHRKAVVQFRLFGTDLDLTLDLIPPGALTGAIDGEQISFVPEADDAYVNQIAGFLDAVEQGDPKIIRSSYRDAVRSLAATLSAIESVRR
jgi:myo-inositol 2-dehydrogenase/D-chiro-inositol 1-dehydrogenase